MRRVIAISVSRSLISRRWASSTNYGMLKEFSAVGWKCEYRKPDLRQCGKAWLKLRVSTISIMSISTVSFTVFYQWWATPSFRSTTDSLTRGNLKLFVKLLETFHSLECVERGASQRGSCRFGSNHLFVWARTLLCSRVDRQNIYTSTGCVLLVLCVGSFDVYKLNMARGRSGEATLPCPRGQYIPSCWFSRRSSYCNWRI